MGLSYSAPEGKSTRVIEKHMFLERSVARNGRRFLSELRAVFWDLAGGVFGKALNGSVGDSQADSSSILAMEGQEWPEPRALQAL